MTLWTICANYDPEARVWYTLDGDIPGLLADAKSIEELAAKAGAMLPGLIDIHADQFADSSVLAGPASYPRRRLPRTRLRCRSLMVRGCTALVHEILAANGCSFVRAGKGDHEIWSCPNAKRPVVEDGRIMSRHLANEVLNQAGVRAKV